MILSAFYLTACLLAEPGGANTQPSARPVEYSTLVLADDISHRLTNESECRAVAGQLRTNGFNRVWLELAGHGAQADLAAIRRVRDVFRQAGMGVCGAITTNWSEGLGQRSNRGPLLCYSAPQTHEALAAITASACRLFDEVMFDDFLFTDCRCERCTKEKGSRSWAEYRCEVKNRVAREFILRPGHQANPRAVIIVKYPQWYDKLHLLGYDAVADTAAFDAIWIGTESRGPDTEYFGYVPTYQSTIIYRWLGGIGGPKTRGGWFDFSDCTPDEFVDQAYCTVLNGASEVVCWNAFASLDGKNAPLMRAFAEHRPHLDALASLVRGRRSLGIVAYKPPQSSSGDEDFWLDYLGNLGVPLLTTSRFPEFDAHAARTLVLTGSARHDPQIDRRVINWTSQGGSVLASPGFLFSATDEVRALFGIERIESRPADAGKLWVGGASIDCPQAMPLGGLLHSKGASVLIEAQAGARRIPLLTRRALADEAFAAVLNLRTRDTGEELLMDRPVSWIDLPEPAANVVRETALARTGLRLRAPARTIVHPFSGHMLHLINARDIPSTVQLRLAEPWFRGLVSGLTARALNQDIKLTPGPDGEFTLTLPPRARWALLSGKDADWHNAPPKKP